MSETLRHIMCDFLVGIVLRVQSTFDLRHIEWLLPMKRKGSLHLNTEWVCIRHCCTLRAESVLGSWNLAWAGTPRHSLLVMGSQPSNMSKEITADSPLPQELQQRFTQFPALSWLKPHLTYQQHCQRQPRHVKRDS